jgi:hypothetical protein
MFNRNEVDTTRKGALTKVFTLLGPYKGRLNKILPRQLRYLPVG